jgi:hypothetical protein
MPLLDHFHPPLIAERHWESFHASWVTKLADALTEHWLPPNYVDVWRSPLGLQSDLVISVDSEGTYAEACCRKRLTGS